MVMGCEKGHGAARALTVEMLDHGPCNAQPIISTCATTTLVEDYQALIRTIVKDVRGLVHLDHEGGVTACKLVTRPYSGENPIKQTKSARACGNK